MPGNSTWLDVPLPKTSMAGWFWGDFPAYPRKSFAIIMQKYI
jgi:hypothetical protein